MSQAEIGSGHDLTKETYPERARRIETELTGRIGKIHELVSHIPSGKLHNFLASEKRAGEVGPYHKLVADLTVIANEFQALFREVPPNYYLQLEISHTAFFGLKRKGEFPFIRSERVDNTLRYYLDCGIYIGNSKGRSVAFLEPVLPQEPYLLPSLMVKSAGSIAYEERYLSLRNISNATVDRIPGVFKPITILPTAKI